MQLREAIQNISDDDFIEINERSKNGLKNIVSRILKKDIKKEDLGYEVQHVRITRRTREYTLHKLFLKEN